MPQDLEDLVAGHLSKLSRIQSLKKVFVIGCAKSGTTWLMNILNGHPRAVVRGEGGFASRLVPVFVQALQAYNKHQLQHGLDFTTLSAADQLMAGRLLVDARLLHYVQASGKSLDDLLVVGDKTPQHTCAVALLAQLYPNSRFVHIIRDPRDATTSAWFDFGHKEGRTLDAFVRYFMTEVWPMNVGTARETGSVLGDRYLELTYENLLDDPAVRIREVLTHVGLPADDGAVNACIAAGRFESHSGGRRRGDTDPDHFYRSGVAGDWVNHLPVDVVAESSAAIGDQMSAFGYSSPSDRAACAIVAPTGL